MQAANYKHYIAPVTEVLQLKVCSSFLDVSNGQVDETMAKRHDFSFGDDGIWSDDLWSDDNTTSTSTTNSWGYDAFWGAGK